MTRYRLGLAAVVVGLAGVAAGCGKPATARDGGEDDPHQVLNRDWQVAAAWNGTTPYQLEDVKDWTWTFGGMIGMTDLVWVAPPHADFPLGRRFATSVGLKEPGLGQALWQIDLADSPFRGGQGKAGAFALRRQGGEWVLRVRLSTRSRPTRSSQTLRVGPPLGREQQGDLPGAECDLRLRQALP